MASIHKKQRRQDRDGLGMMGCSDIAPLSRYTNEPYIVAEIPQYNSYVYVLCTQLAWPTGKWPVLCKMHRISLVYR